MSDWGDAWHHWQEFKWAVKAGLRLKWKRLRSGPEPEDPNSLDARFKRMYRAEYAKKEDPDWVMLRGESDE